MVMMKRILMLMFVAGAVLLTACNKEDEEENAPVKPVREEVRPDEGNQTPSGPSTRAMLQGADNSRHAAAE